VTRTVTTNADRGGGPQRHGLYSAGPMLLDPHDPGTLLSCASEPLLEPLASREREGTIPNVMFPRAIEEIDGRQFIFCEMADHSIGVARLGSMEAR